MASNGGNTLLIPHKNIKLCKITQECFMYYACKYINNLEDKEWALLR